MEILQSDYANFALNDCNGALNRPARILHSENGNSALKKWKLHAQNGNSALRKWKISPMPWKVCYFPRVIFHDY